MGALRRRPLLMSFGSSGAIQALNVLSGVVLARSLGAHSRGELAAVLLWPMLIAAIGSFGIGDAATFHASRRTHRPELIAGGAIAVSILQAAVLVAAGAALIPVALGDYGSGVVSAAWLFLVFVPLNLLTIALMGLLNGMHRFNSFNGLRVLVIAIQACAIAALATFGTLTVIGAVWCYIAANAVVLAATLVLLARAGVRRVGLDRRVVRDLIGFGGRSHAGSAATVANQRLDHLLISLFMAPVSMGLYAIAATTASLAILIGNSAAMVAFPHIAGCKDLVQRRAAALRVITRTVVLSALATVPLLAATPLVIETCFGSDYAGATPACRILLVAAFLFGLNRVLGAVVKGSGRPLDSALAEAAAMVTTAALLLVLLPPLGLVGAALSALIGYSVATLWLIRATARVLELRLVGWFIPRPVGASE